MPTPMQGDGYSIAAVSKLTGISCHSLRVWERRHGLMSPHRLASGHRRYDADQVNTLRMIGRLIRTGRSIGELAQAFHSGTLAPESGHDPCGDSRDATPSDLIARLSAGDLTGGQELYARLTSGLDMAQTCLEVLVPVLVEVGDRWFRGESSVYEERSVTAFVMVKLNVLLERARQRVDRSGPRRTFLVGTVKGDHHCGGALVLSLMLEISGCRAIEMGVDLPAAQFQKAAVAWGADAIAISFILSRNINKRFAELATISEVPVFVGGRSILNYQGLARRHGLIPLTGPLIASIGRMTDELDRRDADAEEDRRSSRAPALPPLAIRNDATAPDAPRE